MVTYKMWCDECDDWAEDVSYKESSCTYVQWICCERCGNGLMKVTL
jgi:hypothetical protein